MVVLYYTSYKYFGNYHLLQLDHVFDLLLYYLLYLTLLVLSVPHMDMVFLKLNVILSQIGNNNLIHLIIMCKQ